MNVNGVHINKIFVSCTKGCPWCSRNVSNCYCIHQNTQAPADCVGKLGPALQLEHGRSSRQPYL